MSQNSGNKAKSRQHSRGQGYYAAQKFRTIANKARRAKARAKFAEKRAPILAIKREGHKLAVLAKKLKSIAVKSIPDSSIALAEQLND